MQLNQRKHDEEYHRDIFFLNYQDRLKHIAFHYAKYSARLARDLHHSMDQNIHSSGHDIGKTLTDAFIMTLSGAELFNQNLELAVRKILGLPAKEESFGQFAETVAGKSQRLVQFRKSSELDGRLLGILIELDDCSGIISKACDSLDHMEGIDRPLIVDTLARILTLLLVAGKEFKVDYEQSVPARLKEIEQKKLL
jgi:hypothetical protein